MSLSDPPVVPPHDNQPANDKPNEPSPLIIPSDPKSQPKRGSSVGQFSAGLLFNVIVPIGLIVAGVFAINMFGVATAPPRDTGDTTRDGRLQNLGSVRVERIRTLESTGEELQLVVDGTVVPFREAKVAAEVAGRVVEKSANCESGSLVKKGEVLMRIDPMDYEIEVDRLTRQKEQEYQALQEIDQEKANTLRLIAVAQRDVDLQLQEVKRQESLPRGFASRGEVDAAKRALLQAEQQLVTAQNSLALLDKRRVRLEASEKLAATQLKAANMNLDRTTITAPIDGVIVSEDADLNTFVNRGTVLLTIEDTSKVEVSTSLRMDQLYWVLDQERDPQSQGTGGYDLPITDAIIQYDLAGRDNQSYQWRGRLLSYDGVGLDPQTRTVPVRVLVEDPSTYYVPSKSAASGDANRSVDAASAVPGAGVARSSSGPTALLRGMYVQVKLLIKPKTPLVVIPGTALQPGNRVWQFVPDESVLDVPKPDADAMKKAAADGLAADKNKKQIDEKSPDTEPIVSSFKPEQWTPGRVVVQRGVFPVDALSFSKKLTDQAKLAAEGFESSLAGERQFWVCEIKGSEFSDDAFVVTSPLSGVDGKELSVRAELKANDPDDKGSSENTTTTDDQGDAK